MPSHRAPVAVVLGTRPEAIKLAPVILALRAGGTPTEVVATGQHGPLVEEVLALFGIRAERNLGIMREGQSLDQLLATAIGRVGGTLDEIAPRAVVVQGDTTSMLGSALAAFHRRIPVAHVEAGLRSGDMGMPFPEEMNRRVATAIAAWQFAPTEGAAANLRREGLTEGIHVVGNTVVDAVQQIVAGVHPGLPDEVREFIVGSPHVLATAHRRESWGEGIRSIALGLCEVLEAIPELRLVFVTHPNPLARQPVDDVLGAHERALVLDATTYPAFLELLRGARLAVSDSGGVQEEGPTLGVPVLVTRRITERPEGVEAGAVRVIGTDTAAVRDETLALLRDADALAAMAGAGRGIYGDGHASERIARILGRA